MKILRQIFLAIVAISAIVAASAADTLIVKAESNQGGTKAEEVKTALPVVSLFNYLKNGVAVWTLDVLGPSPVLYMGFSRKFAGGFSAEIVPGIMLNRENGLRVKDYVLEANVFFDHRRVSVSVVNEIGGIQEQVPFSLFLDHEAVGILGKWRLGIRHVSFFSPDLDFVHFGPVLGLQYGPVRFIIWPWRNVLEKGGAGLLFQAKAVFSY